MQQFTAAIAIRLFNTVYIRVNFIRFAFRNTNERHHKIENNRYRSSPCEVRKTKQDQVGTTN